MAWCLVIIAVYVPYRYINIIASLL